MSAGASVAPVLAALANAPTMQSAESLAKSTMWLSYSLVAVATIEMAGFVGWCLLQFIRHPNRYIMADVFGDDPNNFNRFRFFLEIFGLISMPILLLVIFVFDNYYLSLVSSGLLVALASLYLFRALLSRKRKS